MKRTCMMLQLAAVAALWMAAGAAARADGLAAGTVKSVDADKHEFVLTDAGKDWTFKFADNVMFNRGGKEGATQLKSGDMVQLHYDKGLVNNTAKYILIKEGEAKDWTLAHGKFKGYDAATKQATFTVEEGDNKDMTYALGDAEVRLNGQKSNIDQIKEGDHVLAIMDASGGQSMIKLFCAHR